MREKRLIILFIHRFHDNLFVIAIVVVSFMGSGEKTLWPSSTVFIWISQQRDGVTLVEVKWCIGNKSRWANLVTNFSFRQERSRHSTEVVRKEIKRRLEKKTKCQFLLREQGRRDVCTNVCTSSFEAIRKNSRGAINNARLGNDDSWNISNQLYAFGFAWNKKLLSLSNVSLNILTFSSKFK